MIRQSLMIIDILSTQSLAKSDSGILVVCEAVNSEGMATRETRLQVSGKLKTSKS